MVLVSGATRAAWLGVLAGYGDRVGTGRGNTGTQPTTAKGALLTAKRAPEAPVGAGVGGQEGGIPRGRCRSYPPSGPGRSPCRCPPW